MLKIKNLHVSVNGKKILKGINLNVNEGELHAIMGRNGSGKSTLAQVIAGRDTYQISDGEILYEGKNLAEMTVEQRAHEGIFMAFQYPVVIPGVNTAYFLRTALNSLSRKTGREEMDAVDFLTFIKEKMKLVDMEESYLNRSINEGFSGGEKKRHEILQMLVLEPKLAILDETDSGLDIDAVKIVAAGVNRYLRSDPNLSRKKRACVVITHYQRILQYLDPDYIHVLMNGEVVMSGGKELALKLEEKGYAWLEEGKPV